MSESPVDTSAGLAAAQERGDWATCVRMLEESWLTLMFHGDFGVLSRVAFSLPAAVRRASPLAGTLAEMFGAAPIGTVPLHVPTERAEIEGLAASDDLREFVGRVCLAVMARRLQGRPRAACAMARAAAEVVGRAPLMGLGLSPGPMPGNNVTDLKTFFYLQAGLAAQLADDPGTARWALGAAWRERAHDRSGFAARGAALRYAVDAALAGEPESAKDWMVRADQQPRTSAFAESIAARGSDLVDFIVALDTLDPDEMEKTAAALDGVSEREEQWAFVVWALARHAVLCGEPEQALVLVEQVEALFPRNCEGDGVHPGLVAMARGEAELALGRGNRALAAVSATRPTTYFGRLTEARVALLAGDDERARAVVVAMTADADLTRRARVEGLLIQAVAELRLGLPHAAATAQRVTGMLTARGPTSALLGVPRAALDELAAAVPEAAPLAARRAALHRPDVYPASVELVRLTERERAVLEQLDRETTREDIARALFVSENTVKSQVRSLYAKLGATSRAEAVLRAREWGLLADA
ncbi:hypothetical protein FHP29_00765 [Nocardioides albidus]|uniref:HTH luxR-type domain-containing protein n=1 Tax=Nocardioides albidus TaxID=1517589 RepID=A0A5C4WPM0_9ACTN|nr:LuxR C-terminal-related transcriptional regulator [Nocardioides albidus]TNM50197.1 hypothetical protein FHP29_00765 [Nocardioides albidus]